MPHMDNKTKDPFIVSPREAAGILGVHERTIVRWCDRGYIAHTVTFGGHRRIEKASVLEIKASGRRPSRPVQ